MASSIYIYTRREDYDNLYKGKTEAFTYQTPVLDFFIRPTEGYDVGDSIPTNKLWVITHTDKLKQRPSLERSICIFTNGTCFDSSRPCKRLSVDFSAILSSGNKSCFLR